MHGIIVRWILNAIGLWLAAYVVPGVEIVGTGTLLIAAAILGIVNAIVRPLFVLLTLPIAILSLGLFLLVINATMFKLASMFLDGFAVAGFWSALGGALVVSLVSWLANSFIGPRGRFEVMVVDRHKRR
jgi:putative membrane protein